MHQLIGYFFSYVVFIFCLIFKKCVGIVTLERENGIVTSESVFWYFLFIPVFFQLWWCSNWIWKSFICLCSEYRPYLCRRKQQWLCSKATQVFILKENQIIWCILSPLYKFVTLNIGLQKIIIKWWQFGIYVYFSVSISTYIQMHKKHFGGTHTQMSQWLPPVSMLGWVLLRTREPFHIYSMYFCIVWSFFNEHKWL